MDLIAEMRRWKDLIGSGPAYNQIDVGHALSSELLRSTPYRDATANPIAFGSIPIRESALFPFQNMCSKCEGTGDGAAESTYCQQCKGAGEIRTEGVMTGGSWNNPSMVVITSKLPVKFPVHCTFAAGKRPSSGITAVPWPSPHPPKTRDRK